MTFILTLVLKIKTYTLHKYIILQYYLYLKKLKKNF